MPFDALAQDRRRRPPARSVRTNGLLQLGWPHYWLLVSILGATLAWAIVIVYAHLLSL